MIIETFFGYSKSYRILPGSPHLRFGESKISQALGQSAVLPQLSLFAFLFFIGLLLTHKTCRTDRRPRNPREPEVSAETVSNSTLMYLSLRGSQQAQWKDCPVEGREPVKHFFPTGEGHSQLRLALLQQKLFLFGLHSSCLLIHLLRNL